MRTLFLICIIFSLISWGVVFPINRKQENGGSKKKENPHEKPIEKRECNRFQNFVGSNLFDGIRKVCFSPDDINLLVARRQFEIMIPKELPPGLLDEKTVNHILRYFYHGFWQFRRMEDCSSRRILEKAFYDTLGGFLRYYLVQVCKFSYYASKVELRTVRNVLFLYKKCRDFLNTNGNGWRAPMRNPLQDLKSVKIKPIQITEDEKVNADSKVCSDLDLTPPNNGIEVIDDFMIVPLPKLDAESNDGYLNNIWLPFSKKHTYNLKSCKSAFILVKYYRSVSRCYKKKSVPQKCFDRKFREWIVENLKMHLSDDEFYPGLGGILNVYKNTLENEPAEANQTDENDEVKKKRDLSITIFDEGLQNSKTCGPLKQNELVAKSYELRPLDELLDIVPQTKHLKCRPKCKKIQMKNQTSSKSLNKTDQAKSTKKPNNGFSFKGCTLRYTLLGTTVLLILLILIALSLLLLKIYDGIDGFKRYFKGAFDNNNKKPKEKNAAKPKKEAKSKSSKSSKSSKDSKKHDKAAKKKPKPKDAKKAKKDKDKKRSSSKTSSKEKDSKKAEKEAKTRAKKAEKELKKQKKNAEKASKKSGKSQSKSPKKDPKKSEKEAKKKAKELDKKKKSQKSGSESTKSSASKKTESKAKKPKKSKKTKSTSGSVKSPKQKKASGKKRLKSGSDVSKTKKENFDGKLVVVRSNRSKQRRGSSRIRSEL